MYMCSYSYLIYSAGPHLLCILKGCYSYAYRHIM